jgi:xanthine/uracil/vitamin C permease (AzgA family)
VALIPNAAIFPALLMVGVYSIPAARDIDWADFPTAFAAFITIASMPFLYSIANGIAAGFIFDSFANIVRCTWNVAVDYGGRPHWRHERHAWPHPLMIVLSIFMSLRFAYLD